jgi:hypothetical protein
MPTAELTTTSSSSATGRSTILTDRVVNDATTASFVAATAVTMWCAAVDILFQQQMPWTTLAIVTVIAYAVCIVAAQWMAALVSLVRRSSAMLASVLFAGAAAGAGLWSLLAWSSQTLSAAVTLELVGGAVTALLVLFVWLAPDDRRDRRRSA